MANDICINMPGGIFNYRVGAIIQHDGNLLMVKNSGDNFYYTVGGRVKFGESAEETLLREALEETGLPLEIERLAFIHENFFAMESEQNQYHEICLFFLMKPHVKIGEIRQTFEESYGEVSFHWLPLDRLSEFEMYPHFFKTAFADMDTFIKHYVSHDGEMRK